MDTKQLYSCLLFLVLIELSVTVSAETYVIPFQDIREAVNNSSESPDTAIHDYLARQIRNELDALGLNVDGGLVVGDVAVDEITEIIRTDCTILRPYEIHTDATTATVSVDDSSSLTIGLDSIQSIDVSANLTGTINTDTNAWVRWGQDIIFVGDCIKINTDHGWLGLSMPFDINLGLVLQLDPRYDEETVAIVVDKHATLSGQALFGGGNLQHDFGNFSLTDLVLSIFENELLAQLSTKGEQAIADAINTLNYRMDGLDANGNPDATINAFNGPTTFVLDVSADDKAFIQELLLQLGIPDIVLAMIEDRGVEVLLQLAILEGAERDAYLASLGAAVSCEALLGNFRLPLDAIPIYTMNGQNCEVADLVGGDAGGYFSDLACTDALAFRPTDEFDFCLEQFGDQAKSLLGNAAAWLPDTNQPNDLLPSVASRSWTTVPSTQLDLGVVPLQGNLQPYMKQMNYKTISNLPRGNGQCELEMRVYKTDITDQDLKPLIAIHGGTWQNRGSSFWGLEAGISQLTDRGFIVFAPFYRLVGESDGNVECNGASWRDVTEDVESALDWVKAYGPALGATPERINVFGQSAGAHLAAWLAAHRADDVRKALLYYAPIDALDFLDGAAALGGPYEPYRGFGLRALVRFFGARNGLAELRLDQMDFAGLTPASLSANWSNLIPGSVFDLTQIDPLAPPSYVARCAAVTQTDLSLVNLSMPPNAMIDCMKQDLGEFLVNNSFYHLLGADAVPVFIVHGSGDTIVPYQQAIHLCGLIDNRVLSDDVIDPLTSYACGVASQVRIVQNAEHALDLGVCIEPLCPAGPSGSATRDAVVSAIGDAYLWVMDDPPILNSINVTRAFWRASVDKVIVVATSDLGDQAGLKMTVHLEDGGTVNRSMFWNAAKNRWQKGVPRFTQKYGTPTSVTVDGVEGTASAQVALK